MDRNAWLLAGILFVVSEYLFFRSLFDPIQKKTERIVFSLLSVLCGLTFLTVNEIPESEGGQMMLTTPGLAFWFWISSFLMLLFSIVIYSPDKTKHD